MGRYIGKFSAWCGNNLCIYCVFHLKFTFRLALGSFVEEYNNKVQIVSLDENAAEFAAKSTFDHPYPTTKIMWIPDTKGNF